MTNLAHAYDLATTLARYMFTDVSDNRRTDRGEYNESYILRNSKKQTLNALRSHSQFPGTAGSIRANVLAYGEHVLKNDAANCLEISCAAAYILNTQLGVRNWDLVHYTGGGDHVFVAIGDCGGYDDNFGNWPASCAIFDGWAQIACLASDYPTKWSAKMNEWTSANPPIELPGPTGGGFGDATAWRPVVTGSKASYLT